MRADKRGSSENLGKKGRENLGSEREKGGRREEKRLEDKGWLTIKAAFEATTHKTVKKPTNQ